jgi:Rieske 2Fe-2S family protein
MQTAQTIHFPAPPARQLATLRTALSQCRAGHALPRAFYTDPDLFALDMHHFVTAHWHCVGHTSMLPAAGDFFTAELAGESFILVRGEDGQVRALLNVCRHRGSRLCDQAQGHASQGRFVCPYHAWTYDTAGLLQAARLSEPGFRTGDFPLKQARVHVEEGMIFITLAREPLGLAHVQEAFAVSAKVYGWQDAKVAARKTYQIQANWKLVEENYQECYHCGPAHQEYSKRHTYARSEAQREAADAAMRARDETLGIGLRDTDFYFRKANAGQESADSIRSALVEGMVSGSRDGQGLAPLMGDFKGRGYDGGFSFIDVGPTSNFVAYPDHTLLYRTIPQSVDRTAFELIWLVDGAAREGVDYQVDALTWLWDHTSQEDRHIIETNQQGVNSVFFEPGPYNPMEIYARQYTEWYLEALHGAVSNNPP